jgi:DNA processing protein
MNMKKAIEITQDNELYPKGLLKLNAEAPESIWAIGDVSMLENIDNTLVVAGARASTGYGEHVTMEIVSGLSDRDVTIMTDGAYGIAGMATRAALANNKPTMVWLAGGVDRLYPSGHDALLKRVIETGLIISAYPSGFAPTKERFEYRAKHMAYATAGSLIVEAGFRSGSLQYAQQSRYAGKFSLAVPGPVTSAVSYGVHELIKTGYASLVTTADDVYEHIQNHKVGGLAYAN